MIRRFMIRGATKALCRYQASFSSFQALSNKPKAGNEDIWESAYKQKVPRNMEELTELLKEEAVSPPNSHLLKVAIIGMPNSGKSTLINKLMGWRMCSASCKVHTTQMNARAVYNVGSTQMIFLDTPGIVSPQEVTKHKLQRNLLTEPEMSLYEADLLAVVHDISCHFNHSKLHPRLIRLLSFNPTIPTILVLNKVDLVKSKKNILHSTQVLTEGIVGGINMKSKTKKSQKLNKETLIRRALLKEKLSALNDQCSSHCSDDNDPMTVHKNERLEFVQAPEVDQTTDGSQSKLHNISHSKEKDIMTGKIHLTEQEVQAFIQDRKSWPLFADVFMISAKDGTGVDDLREYLLSCAEPRPWVFNDKIVTDQNPEDIAIMTVREKFLNQFKQEIPYTLKFSIEHWDVTESDLLSITIKVECARMRLMRHLLGSKGCIISKLAKEAEQDLRNTFRNEVKLRLNVMFDKYMKKRIFGN